MITLVYESKEQSPLFENEMREISGIEEVQCICVTDLHLARAFNDCLDQASHNIVIFLREGVSICSKDWGRKVVDSFSTSSHGIIGTLGTIITPMSGMLWEKEEPLCGSIWYDSYSPENKNTFGEVFDGKVIDVVALEGSFVAIHKDRLASNFDETFIGNSFYEVDFCVENYRKGVKIGVIFGIDILKDGFDEQDEEFILNQKKFIKKHKKLPYRIIPKIDINKEEVILSENPSVNIVIVNKGHVIELFTCLESIYEKSNYPNYTITIIDNGSSKKEITEISHFIKNHENTKLIKSKQPHISELYNTIANDIESDLVLFLSNHIILANDIISLMVETYLKNKDTCGTVGIRTHQKNHMVRQMGLKLYSMETEDGFELALDFKGFGKAFSYQNSIIEGILGNTKECFLIKRNLFLELGGFNLNYLHSLEDFEINLKLILNGKKNILDGRAVAYYLGFERPKFLPKDYMLLMEYINKNIEVISSYVSLIKY